MLNDESISELELLLCYDLDSVQQGIKLHNGARPELLGAAQRLFDKGFVSQYDGGYLTDLGREAATHAQSVFSLLTTGGSSSVT
jgi:uncharacterized protein (TIGR02647 family)